MSRNSLFAVAAALLLAAAALFGLNALQRPPPGRLALQIETKPAVMSAAYKVYANRETGDGRYWLAKVILKNEGAAPLEDVRVSYEIPGLVPATTPKAYPALLPGQTVVALFYPRFPDTVATKTTNTTEQIDFRVEYGADGQRKQEARQMNFQLRARNDMLYTTMPESEIVFPQDLYENTELIAAFVTPDDPVIKYFVQQLEQKLMGGTTVGAGADPDEVLRFMNTVYAFWVANGIVYGGTEGLPEKTGTAVTMVQHIRLPREVLTGQAGLCVELAALFASIAQSAGLEPVMMLTGGHAWPAIKVGNSLVPIEATAVGMPGRGARFNAASFEDAIKAGQKNMQIWSEGGNDRIGPAIAALDITSLHGKGIVPPELADDPALKQKIDDAIARLTSGRRPARVSEAAPTSNGERQTKAADTGNRYTDPRGYFSVSLPGTWTISPNPNPQAPWVALIAADASAGIGIEVYVFPGVDDEEQALSGIQGSVVSSGGIFNYRDRGNATLRGRTYRHFTGVTAFPARGTATEWDAYLRAADGTTVVLSLDAPQGRLSAALPILQQVAATFSVRA